MLGRLELKAFHYAIEGFAGIAKKFPNLRLKIVKNRWKNLNKIFSVEKSRGFQNMIPYYLHAKATLLSFLFN